MPRIDLDVPYAEKDEAKRLGARWDPQQRRWYVPDDVEPGPFRRWQPSIAARAEPQGNVRCDRFGVFLSVACCWKCQKQTPVACLMVDDRHEQLEADEDDEGWFWQPYDYYASLGTVTFVSAPLLACIASVAPWLRMTYSKTVNTSYLGNCCTHCASLQGDFFLHCEPGGAFFALSEEDCDEALWYAFDEPIDAEAGQIGPLLDAPTTDGSLQIRILTG